MFPKTSLKWDGNKMEKWDGGRCSDTCKARGTFQYKYQATCFFGGYSPWTLTRDLGFKFFGSGHGFILESSCCRLESSQVSHYLVLPSFLSTGPCQSIESQQKCEGHQPATQFDWQWRSQGLVLGTGVCGSRPRNGEIKCNQVVYQFVRL